MYLIGRLSQMDDASSSNGLVEINGLRALIKGKEAFKEAVAINYGGSSSDYDVMEVTDPADESRIRNGDEFLLTWTGDLISGVDFSPEETKQQIGFSVSKSQIIANNIDKSIVKVYIYQSDGVTIDTSYSGIINLEIKTPTGGTNRRLRFRKGYASFFIKTNDTGSWVIPSRSDRVYDSDSTELIINSTATISSL